MLKLGHVTDLVSTGSYFSRFREDVNKKFKIQLKSIVISKSETFNKRIEIHITDEKFFCMGQMLSQCGWVVVGDFHNIKTEDYFLVTELAMYITQVCTYGGLYINASSKDKRDILENDDYICVFPTKSNRLYYKGSN